MLTVKLENPDHGCRIGGFILFSGRCNCMFIVSEGKKEVAACLDKDALDAVKRLYEQKQD